MNHAPLISRIVASTAIIAAVGTPFQPVQAATGETAAIPPAMTLSDRKIQLVEAVVDKVRTMAKLDDTNRSNDRFDIVESVIRKTQALKTNAKYANKPEILAFADMIITALGELRSEGATSDSFVVDLFTSTPATATSEPVTERTRNSGTGSQSGSTASTGSTATGTDATRNPSQTNGTQELSDNPLDQWGFPAITNLARGDELVARTRNIALITNNGTPWLKAVDDTGSVLRHMGTTPASIFKSLWNYDIPLSQLETVTLAGKNAGISKFGQYDFYDLSKGGMGATFDWTQDANLKSKGISGARTLADNRVVAVRAKLKPSSLLQNPIPVYDYCGPDACAKATPKIIGYILPASDPTRIIPVNP